MAFYFYTIIRTLSIGILVNITNICKKSKIKYYKKNRPLRGHWNIPRNQKNPEDFSPLIHYYSTFLVILLFNYSH